MEEYVRVPLARIGVIIGKHGEVKRTIEESLNIVIEVDTETGETRISSTESTEDPLAVWKGRDIIRAIARGFSPRKALKLAEDDMAFEIIDLSEYFGKSENTLKRVRGRIIGRNGMTRKIIETMTGASVSVYGRTVSLVGNFEEVADARRSVEMLIKGSMHSTVYKFLENLKKGKRREGPGLWKENI